MNINATSISVLALSSLGLAPLASSQGDPEGVETAPDAIDARVFVHTDRPLLVRGDIAVSFTVGPLENDMKSEVTFVDTVTKLGGGVEEGTRRFLESHDELNGEIADQPLTGLRLRFERQAREVSMQCLDGCILTEELIDELLDTQPSLGVWLDFPESVQVGDEFEVDFMPLSRLLCGWDAEVSDATAQMRLEAYDADATLATIVGRLRVTQKVSETVLFGAITWEGECRIQSNLTEDRITGIEYEGTLRFIGGGVAEEGEGEFSVKIATEIGKRVEKAVRAKPRYRDRLHTLTDMGLTIELPSNWMESTANEPGEHLFFRTSAYETDRLHIYFIPVTADSSNPEESLETLDAHFEDDSALVKTKKVSCKLGNGRAYFFEYPDEEGRDQLVRSEYYPLRREWLVFKLSGDPKAARKHLREFEKARKSLRLAP